MHDGGTVVVIEGPRFSTRAESAWFRAMGWDLVNMTAYPEGWLARELGLCYANLSLVTDYDVGVAGDAAHAAVTAQAVLAAFAANIERLRAAARERGRAHRRAAAGRRLRQALEDCRDCRRGIRPLWTRCRDHLRDFVTHGCLRGCYRIWVHASEFRGCAFPRFLCPFRIWQRRCYINGNRNRQVVQRCEGVWLHHP